MERFTRESVRWLAGTTAISALALFLLTTAGCQQGGEGTVAPTKGKVTFQGEPVTGGSITLRPTEQAEGVSAGAKGKPASGGVQSDGTFVLSTFESKDGALVGTHEVIYAPPVKGAESYEDVPEKSPYEGLVPKETTVTITNGENDLTIELVPGSGKSASTTAAEKPASK